MNVLVTGGAGYIGSHAVKKLISSGHKVVVLDNLCHGHRGAIDPKATFIQSDVFDQSTLAQTLLENKIDAVMHFAAFIEVGESVLKPEKYFKNNFEGGLVLLNTMKDCGVKKLVFSSTAAVYGDPIKTPIPEDHPRNPINPYGRSKLMMEFAIEDFCTAYGLGYVILRYFNVAGAASDGSIGEAHEPESHLIPRILEAAAGDAASAKIFGTDYPTPDGTCIRDYVHVEDLALAHELALNIIQEGRGEKINLGSEAGFSVKEVIEACKKITQKPFHVETLERRPGDPAVLVASSEKAKRVLKWQPKRTNLHDIISDAWRWQIEGLPKWKAEFQKTAKKT